MEELLQEIKTKLDEMRIRLVLEQEKYRDAVTLFKYSDLTKEEFIKLEEETFIDKSDEETTEVDNKLDSAERVNSDDKWNQVLAIIKNKVSAPSYDTWFKGIKTELKDNTVKLIIENNFAREWLMSRYCDLLDETVQDVYGYEYGIEFVENEVKY